MTAVATRVGRLILLVAACAAPLAPGRAAASNVPAAAPVVRFVALPAQEDGYAGALPEIYVEGPIAETTLPQLRRIVEERRLSAARVLFDSEGGDLLAAMEFGDYLREQAFVTDVGAFGGAWGRPMAGVCHSACAVAFLGGKYRYLDPGSRMAVHQFTTPRVDAAPPRQVEQETQALAGQLASYVRRMGVDLAFFDRMSRRPHEDLEWLGVDELRRMNVVNDGRLAPAWDLEIRGDEILLAGRQERIDNSGSVTLRCRGGFEVEFATSAFDPAWIGAVDAANLLWALGSERYAIRERDLSLPVGTGGGEFRAIVRLNAFEAGRLSAAPSIGLAADVDGRFYEFRVDTGDASSRELVRRYVDYCQGIAAGP